MARTASSAVDKALDLIEAVAVADRPLRLTDIAASVGMHRATAYRVLVGLGRRGWVIRTGDRYLAGGALLQISSSAAAGSLAALGRPALVELSERTALMANLQVLDPRGSRIVDVVRPERLNMIADLRGEILPVHRFAGTMALVAMLPEADREPYLTVAAEAGSMLDGPHGLVADLERTRHSGFALMRGRNDAMIASLATAVPSSRGAPLCALTVVGPEGELAESELGRLQGALARAARDVGDRVHFSERP